MAHRVEATMRGYELHLSAWANSPEVLAYVRANAPAQRADGQTKPAPATPQGLPSTHPSRPSATDEVRAAATDFLADNQRHFESLTLVGPEGRARFRVDSARGADGRTQARFMTEDIPSSAVRADGRAWTATDAGPLRAPVTYEPYGASVRLTFPLLSDDEPRRAVGALVAEMKLGALFEEAGADAPTTGGALGGVNSEGVSGGSAGAPPVSPPMSSSSSAEAIVVALDNPTGRIIYHTSGALRTRPADAAMPFFGEMAGEMRAGAGHGSGFYSTPDGDRWLAAFRQVGGLDASLAVGRNYGAASAGVRRARVVAVALPVAAGLSALVLLWVLARRQSRRIESVTAGAAAIAGGDLNQRIEVSASGETRGLAESFNMMSDRLREHIARETESRQFESFMRLSAMLTHDLKNSITGLSMLVNNMEKQFHVAEFRADAISSLREATEKLRSIVSRLNEPMRSLSGEYRSAARETDLVPIIRRVVSVNAEPSRPLYEIELRLPETLLATIEPERIENVLENLVINALEAMGAKGGRLTVEAGVIDAGHVFFSVSDTGRGMSREFVERRLFRPFATTKTKGIGLGLFTCREIVETHGGRLEVESELGVGTRFRVVLPSGLFSSRRRQTQKGASSSGPTRRGA
jgi:signal transduction histidine kinase